MMTDIVERLRLNRGDPVYGWERLCHEAADEIEQLRSHIEKLRMDLQKSYFICVSCRRALDQ